MDRIWLRWWGCGAFDVRFGDVNIAFDPYLFGENLDNAQPIYDYIFISTSTSTTVIPRRYAQALPGGALQADVRAAGGGVAGRAH